MKARDLLREPIWQGTEVGHTIPCSRHAVSVALPRWQDVVGYEEKSPELLARLSSGYPRFVIHPIVQELANHLGKGEPCLPFPSACVAELCANYVRQASGETARVLGEKNIYGVATTPAGVTSLRAFWQHTGLIVCSRQAEAVLAGRAAPETTDAHRTLRRQLANFYDCSENDVFLQPTGMAAQYAALSAVSRRRPGLPTVQLGFPYVDTLKLQRKLGHGGVLLHNLQSITEDLKNSLEERQFAAAFGEIPGNPLLGSSDLREINPILRRQSIPLVADDVVATPYNVDLSPYADLVATSLTKYIVGTGEAMGGALICNPKSPFYAELKSILKSQHEELLWGEEAEVLAANAASFPERMQKHNENGLFIAEQLRRHPAVERVWYPKWEFSEPYEAVRRPKGGWGSLVTFLPRNAEVTSPGIYDRLAVCKGPSLGTNFTLACPFTLLAHYTELDWAESCGVSRYLIRLSVGLENPQELWERIRRALSA